MMAPVKGLRQRLQDGEIIICAEGYLREFERRGFLRLGDSTPEVVLKRPDQVKMLSEEFVHCGSDVVEAYTYFGHRYKMQMVGMEDDTERLNRKALQIAREVANKMGTLMAGNISNTNFFDPYDEDTHKKAKTIFKEQVEWAVEEGADFIIGETFCDFAEAKLALEAIQAYGKGLPAVITLTAYWPDKTTDDVPIPEALRSLEVLGADVVGLNCSRGPDMMLPLLKETRKVCKGPLAALPSPYRTTDEEMTFQSLTDPQTGKNAYPLDIECRLCNRNDITRFTQQALDIGIQYLGLCCGTLPIFIREMAIACGRKPVGSNYAPQISNSLVRRTKTTMTPHQEKKKRYMLGL